MKEELRYKDLDKLYIIAKHIAESDSIGRCFTYCNKFTEDNFNEGLKGSKTVGDYGDYVDNAIELYDKLYLNDK